MRRFQPASYPYFSLSSAKPKLLPGYQDSNFETKTVHLGSNVTLECPFVDFNHLEWLNNSDPYNSKKTKIDIKNISPKDEGLYECRVRNEAGSKKYMYNVIVFCEPIFQNAALNQTTFKAISTENFTFNCEVDGYPAPDVSNWNTFFIFNFFSISSKFSDWMVAWRQSHFKRCKFIYRICWCIS